MSLLEKLKDDIEGVNLIKDWLGEGGEPVSQMKADHRAFTCAFGNNGFPCPENKEPGWWDRVKSVIANWIRAELELKNHLNMRVASEDAVHMCRACGCCLKLKVWTPISYIKTHMPPEKIAKTTSYCWIRKEINELQ